MFENLVDRIKTAAAATAQTSVTIEVSPNRGTQVRSEGFLASLRHLRKEFKELSPTAPQNLRRACYPAASPLQAFDADFHDPEMRRSLAAQSSLFSSRSARSVKDFSDLEALAAKVVSSVWWRNEVKDSTPPTISLNPQLRHGTRTSRSGYHVELSSINVVSLAYTLAHLASVEEVFGPHFRGCNIAILGLLLGPDYADKLRAAFGSVGLAVIESKIPLDPVPPGGFVELLHAKQLHSAPQKPVAH